MVRVAQLVRASDCGSEGRGFEPHLSPIRSPVKAAFFVSYSLRIWGIIGAKGDQDHIEILVSLY